ncbi:A-kinase anchor protein 11 isoform X1 [Salmo salar]|uniref:A-kinase anchor protein 11 isoform X1 n=1 Tax=Salmo salar TaxID=8030 RepID=A0A1S3PNZ0_SALSA|nr:A-kinase anchor protein 11 isoform X1 [Salmo salar]XP_014029378.2 A-kinase anchor protein 11 isoform X1 [Salmo salar]XP_014029379.2 A-kinase anchor protein 11 isoform X1 [Salmo salar]XP_014029380.2 A-kinase anchor protein 11 isoform X1 [Salmo salar]
MDACARIRGVPLRTRASRKEVVRDGGTPCMKSLLSSRKELCSVGLELQTRDTPCLTEIHFVCLPGHSEGEDLTLQALSSLPGDLVELLRSLHVTSLKNEEVLLLKDSRRSADRRDSSTQQQCWLKAVCVLRPSPSQAIVGVLVGLLGRYAAGVRYALELQALHKGTAESCQPEDDNTNQSVSSIEDDFVTALEHLEEEEDNSNGSYLHGNQRDMASQTVPAHKRNKDLSGSRIIISSAPRKSLTNRRSPPEVSITVQHSRGAESQWTLYSPRAQLPSPTRPVSDSEESDGSSPSPIIFLDEVGYQKSLKATLDIPQIPGGPTDRVEDSDSEVSEFFDSFDQFDDLDELSSESCTLTLPLDPTSSITPTSLDQKKKYSEAGTGKSGSKKVSRSCSTMNPHRFDQRTLPANVKKPTPLRSPLPPGSPFGSPDSPRPARTSCEESGGPLFSPVSSSAFSPLGDGGALDFFWKTEGEVGDVSELRKPQDLCTLYKTYSDFASSLSKEILGSVCGYQSPVNLNDNKNLSCVCHKEFQNQSGHIMKLSEIQETVTLSKLQQKPQSLKDGIQRFATDLVEMSLGSALRDLQKGMSSCTTTLCHLAARLTSSVFQMAFQEIGMRHAYVLKERAINGLAGFLVGEAVSGALKDFLMVKKQMFNSTVTQFAADLAEELVFEGMMEVCQFSHPSTPLTPSDWSFGVGEDDDEEVMSSYASDLSESVLQEAFIELSQADVAFSTQAAISVSVDNICYVSAVDTHTTCSTAAGHQAFHVNPAEEGPGPSGEDGCTVKKALFCVSGMASCVPVPQAGQAISHLHDSEEICQCKTSLAQTSPKRSCSSENRVVTTTSSDATAATQTDLLSKTRFHNFSGNMVDMIVSEACELMTATKMKKKVEDCADFLSKTIVGRGPPSGQEGSVTDQTSLYSLHPPFQTPGGVNFEAGSKTSRAVAETRPVMMDTLEVPGLEMGGWGGRKMATCEEMVRSPGHKSNRTPGTPPSTPQQPSEVSQEKQIKQFSKKLKGKLAKEFSTATPPPTPHYQPGPEPKESTSETDKADFMLKLMRSLSEEADGNEEEEEEEGRVEGVNSVTETGSRMQPELNLLDGGHKMADKGALHYAERLACHIVSMATEIDTLGGVDDEGRRTVEGREERRDSMAQFSAQTLNTLWIYAGEVAGEVISDVKRIMWSGQCHHSALKQGSQEQSVECPHHYQPQPSEHSKDCRVGRLAEQWSNDLLPVLHPSTSTPSSGLSSDYPSCESVTDEYAGYLIRVLKKEGGSRELVLDQYASRLAYRSIKLGLAHAARNMKRPSSSRHHHSRRLQQNGCRGPNAEPSVPRDEAGRVGSPSRDIDDGSQREYMELVNFAESLACNITCDVTRKLCVPSVRLPKSRTDSCLYKKSKLEDMAESLIRNSFSCPLLSKEGNSRQYHSTGSLYDGGYSSGVMEVLEHYARNIVDDTLEMGLASAGNPAQQGPYRHHHSERRAVGSALGETTCQYCQVRECLFCSRPNRQHLLGGGAGQRRRGRLEGDVGVCGLEIPEIHINLDRRAVFAEEMVTTAMEGAKRELSNTSLNADSGIGHDGYSFAESLTAEIMTSALSNTCQTTNLSFPGREATESSVSQQLSLSVGDDSLGSWSRLSFEDEHPDETSSFLHLSDSNGNSSSWSSLGLEGEVYEEHLSFSPSDSEGTEDKELETKDESCGSVRVGQAQAYRHLLVVNSELREMTPDPQHMTFDPQLRSMLQWAAASMADLPMVQLSPSDSRELQQLPAVVQRLKDRKWKVGELLQALLRYCEETHAPPQSEPREAGRASHHTPLFPWLLEHA